MLKDFLEMGGHATYIWSSYAVVLVVLAGLLMVSLSGMRARRRELKALENLAGAGGAGRRRRSRDAAPEIAPANAGEPGGNKP